MLQKLQDYAELNARHIHTRFELQPKIWWLEFNLCQDLAKAIYRRDGSQDHLVILLRGKPAYELTDATGAFDQYEATLLKQFQEIFRECLAFKAATDKLFKVDVSAMEKDNAH